MGALGRAGKRTNDLRVYVSDNGSVITAVGPCGGRHQMTVSDAEQAIRDVQAAIELAARTAARA